MMDRSDILSRPDIEWLVNVFYSKVRADEAQGLVFDGVAMVNWEAHLPKLYDFWDTVLFRAGTFRGNPIAAHIKLVQQADLSWPKFERWLELFRLSVEQLFAGENADHIVRCAEDMARVIHSKIHDIPNPRFDPDRLHPSKKLAIPVTGEPRNIHEFPRLPPRQTQASNDSQSAGVARERTLSNFLPERNSIQHSGSDDVAAFLQGPS